MGTRFMQGTATVNMLSKLLTKNVSLDVVNKETLIKKKETDSEKITAKNPFLQGRLFSYTDTHRHRLGPNYLQLPVNCPYKVTLANNQRDGPMCFGDNQGGAPNYFPNSFNGQQVDLKSGYLKFPTTGDVARYCTLTFQGSCQMIKSNTINRI